MDTSFATSQSAMKSTLVLANAAELVSGVIRQIAGNDISNSINGTSATGEVIKTICLQRITKVALKQLADN